MRHFTLFLLLFMAATAGYGQKAPLLQLRYQENYSPTYEETIEMFRRLDEAHANAVLQEAGLTDCGRPLHTFIISKGETSILRRSGHRGKRYFSSTTGFTPENPKGLTLPFFLPMIFCGITSKWENGSTRSSW